MTVEALRRIASVHGLLAWISAALLGLAAGLLARRSPTPQQKQIQIQIQKPALAVSALATALAALVSGFGMLLHEPYLNRLRQRIFVKDPALGWLFERKEHLAFGSLGLALSALASLAALALLERRLARLGAPASILAPSLRRAALTAYAASAGLALAACILSTLVARRFRF